MTSDERRLLAILFTDIVGYTALVGADERSGIEAREEHRRLVESLSRQFHGEFVDESGDASLSIFPSSVDAVRCAMAIQAVLASDPAFQVRIGLHVGDVVTHEGRLIGDGINVASRLPALAEPGGIVATDRVVEHLRNQRIATAPLGAKQLKNVAEPVPVFAVSGGPGASAPARGGSRRRVVLAGAGVVTAGLLVWLFLGGGAEELVALQIRLGLLKPGPGYEQEIAFTRADDGTRIAWSSVGAGPAVVTVVPWFTHLEQGYMSPGWNPVVPALGGQHRVVLYDGRGSGLSDRGIADFSLEAKLADLEAVVEAAGLDRFGLIGISAGGQVAIAYAVAHPERVTRIAFYGSFANLDCKPGHLQRWKSFPALVRGGWGEDNPAFRELFSRLFMPTADDVDIRVFGEIQRIAANPDDAAGFIESMVETDVAALAPRIRAPTLVIHMRGDQIVPVECGRELAALIPGAHLLTLDYEDHAFRRTDEAIAFSTPLAAFFAEDVEAASAR